MACYVHRVHCCLAPVFIRVVSKETCCSSQNLCASCRCIAQPTTFMKQAGRHGAQQGKVSPGPARCCRCSAGRKLTRNGVILAVTMGMQISAGSFCGMAMIRKVPVSRKQPTQQMISECGFQFKCIVSSEWMSAFIQSLKCSAVTETSKHQASQDHAVCAVQFRMSLHKYAWLLNRPTFD